MFFSWEKTDGVRHLFVVLQDMRTMILRLAYDNMLTGHYGLLEESDLRNLLVAKRVSSQGTDHTADNLVPQD